MTLPLFRQNILKYPLKDIKISGISGNRILTCFCGQECSKTIIPHLKKKHAEVYKNLVDEFISLSNEGYSPKKIINFYKINDRFLFSWNVIETEIRKIFENNPDRIIIKKKEKIKEWQPKNFILERTTVWSFSSRGSWAVHTNEYRGNWPPQLVRNLVQKYTKSQDWVLDIFAGGGTTLFETWLMNRHSVGIDISPKSEKIIQSRTEEMAGFYGNEELFRMENKPLFIRGNSKNIKQLLETKNLHEKTFQLICAHPPYLDSLKYSHNIEGELSSYSSVENFIKELGEIIENSLLFLNINGILAFLIGDVRRNGSYIPLGFLSLEMLLKKSLILKEIIIKEQHHDTSTNVYVNNKAIDYLLAHEYLFIMIKRG